MSTFVAIDFETSHHGRDSACAVGLVRVQDGQITRREVRLIRPPLREILHTRIHGIRWSDLHDKPPFAEVWADLQPILDGAHFLAAHNASFDRSVLKASCAGAGIAMPDLPWRCSMRLARQHWDLHPTKLPDLARRIGFPLDHHDALSDAECCAMAILAMGIDRVSQAATRRR